jgi:cytidylate kinase
MAPKVLTVSGIIGSGKTTVCREIAKLTGWRIVSAGSILRKMAEDSGLSVLEFNQLAKQDASIDQKIDDSLRALNDSADPLIVDSRLAWHFIQNSYKIHLVVDKDIAAQRVFAADRKDETYATAEEAYRANVARQRAENERFQQYYGIDCELWSNYDLVLDSGTLTPPELAEKALAAHSRYARGPECWLDPRRLRAGENAVASNAQHPVVRSVGEEVEVVAGWRIVEKAREQQEPLVVCALA